MCLAVVATLALLPGVAAADWSAPERVGGEYLNTVLVGSDGRALLIGGEELYVRSPGGAFTGRPLSEGAARFGHFALAGDVVVGSWETIDSIKPRLMGSVGTLQSPLAPVALSTGVSRVISVAASPNGHAVVAESRCFYVRVPSGKWTPCLRAADGHLAEAVAVNDRGDVAVLLERSSDEVMALAFRPAGGVFGAPVAVAAKHMGSSGIALDDAGNTLAAFDAVGGVVVARRAGDGAVTSDLVAAGGAATDLVADESGRVLLTWAQPDGSGHAVMARSGTVAGGLSGAAARVGRAPGNVVRTTGAVAPDGRAVVAWAGGDTVGAAALPSGDAVTLTKRASSNVLAAGISDAGEGVVAYTAEQRRVHVAVHDRAPRLTRLRVRPATLRPGDSVRIAYRLSKRAKVRFAFERKQRRSYRKVAGSLSRKTGAGARAFRFHGRVGDRSLAPGRYRLVARPKGGAAVRRTFTVARG
jgi:hypothetical protein